MFARGQLTRHGGVDPRALIFAVLDLETTGLHPGEGSRVCEVGVVRMRGDGEVLDEYSTLVNPEVSIVNDEYHGIANVDTNHAPTFGKIAGDLLAYLSGAVVVSHHLDHDEGFLDAEFGRLGVTAHGVPGCCSLVTARTQLDRWDYKLDNLANLITGEWPSVHHAALADARTLAAILARLIAEAPQPLYWMGPPLAPLPSLPRSGVITPRAAGLHRGTEGWLATLTARLPYMASPPRPRPDGLRDYRALLAHTLSDGRIVGDEAKQLAILAARAGLTQTTARKAHEKVLAEARNRAVADGVVSATELEELQGAAKELAASHLIRDLTEAASPSRAGDGGQLKGWRVLPIGDSARTTEAVEFAVEHGAKVAVNLTRTVRLVISDVPEDDSRILKARAAGVEVLPPDQAMKIMKDEVAKARGALFIDPVGEQLADRLTAERAADSGPARPEWHEFWRPYELTPDQYHTVFVERRNDWDAPRREIRGTVPVQQVMSQSGAGQQKGGCLTTVVTGGTLLAGIAELIRQMVA